jgi:hypothetical protein
MPKRALLVAAAALAASAVFALPASAAPEMPIRGAVAFWLLDRNNDGAIDKAEIEQLRAAIFDAVDANGDGKVTKDEFTEVIDNAREWRGGHGPRHGRWEEHGERRGGRGKAEFAGHRGERMMDRLGIDGAEGLSKADFIGRTPMLFERADEDDNGSVSKSEFEQAAGRIGRLILMD